MTAPTTMQISGFQGHIIGPESDGFDDARAIWNGAVDRRPRLIARCTSTADVAAAIRFARDHDLEIAVRGGGHNVAGTAVCDDGIVIDLSAMRGVTVNPVRRTARVQGGALWGDVDHATQAHGLATTGGIVSHTGVGGVSLGGGIGWLMRKHGLVVDNLLEAEVVTADGDVIRVSADDHDDLFWALRGGGGNFGVVTMFRFRLHPIGPTVLAGPVFWAAEDTAEVLRFYRDFVADAPDELGNVVRLGTIPPWPSIDEKLHFRPAIAVASCYAGPVGEGERVVRPLREFGTPLVDLVGPTLYVNHQQGIDDTVPHGWHYYWKSANLTGMSDEVIDIAAEHAYEATSPRSMVVMFHLGGAVARVPPDATAYPSRDATYNIVIEGVWLPAQNEDVAVSETAWARTFLAALRRHRAGVYVNFLDADDDTSRVREAYGDDTYRRLAEIKARYDPDNVFHNNKNIEPGTRSTGAGQVRFSLCLSVKSQACGLSGGDELEVHRLRAHDPVGERDEPRVEDRVLLAKQARGLPGLLARKESGERRDSRTRRPPADRARRQRNARISTQALPLPCLVPGAEDRPIAVGRDVDGRGDRGPIAFEGRQEGGRLLGERCEARGSVHARPWCTWHSRRAPPVGMYSTPRPTLTLALVRRAMTTDEPLRLLANLLTTLGTTVWTGVVLVVFVEVLPEARRREAARRLKAYEAELRDQESD